MSQYQPDDRVKHPQFGVGSVIVDSGDTVIVRFDGQIHECAKSDLHEQVNSLQAITQDQWDDPREVLARCMAATIESINNAWGVFSRSRIALLPHQLWVCHQVLKSWPMRWLVADDVGLGKTIEAGLILWPLISRGTVKRLLILCPASLVDQWQYRLRTMFDIRVDTYKASTDTPRSDYWHAANRMVVASLQTLRQDHKGRHERLLASPAWDLVLVDEAHHLNNEEHSGSTLGYQLLEQLMHADRITSMVFFTGTPHKGKDYNFLSLLHLLRPDVFDDPKKDMTDYLQHLPEVLIRNNKYSVTDLQGNTLFTKPNVAYETYQYSPEEQRFYDMLTDFITSGKAYAQALNQNDQRTVKLVLIALQKLASSSVAAVRSAIRKRLQRLQVQAKQGRTIQREYQEAQNSGDDDKAAQLEEDMVALSSWVKLLEGEQERLAELLEAAEQVKVETKIERILELVNTRFPARSVLFFSEYKATQSLLMSRLVETFGKDSTTFINGDSLAKDVCGETWRITREQAAEAFNRGEKRFLVSTEAAGEGVDLQQQCHTLIHVDLPWNPMRLHQRVGRVNRYGQEKQVDVVALRNPDTVESHIWSMLNDKLERIQTALMSAMDEPEDLLQFVLGMTSPELFTKLFAEARDIPKASLDDWFDRETANFGGQDVIDTVKALVGNSLHFDYQQVSSRIPKLDLPQLEPFFRLMLTLNKRRVSTSESGLSFKTPDTWNSFGISREYIDMHFERTPKPQNGAAAQNANGHILGIGHPLINHALQQASTYEAFHCLVTELDHPVYIFKISNRLTTEASPLRTLLVSVLPKNDTFTLLNAEQSLRYFNDLSKTRPKREQDTNLTATFDKDERAKQVDKASTWLTGQLAVLDVPFQHPAHELFAALWPVQGQ
jgi:superfamily II DNA or RNA helicase